MSNDDNEIRYKPNVGQPNGSQPNLWRLCGLAGFLAFGFQAVRLLVDRNPAGPIFLGFLLCFVLLSVLVAVQRFIVDTRGIRRTGRRGIPWAEVASVQRPGRFDDVVKVTLRSGKSVSAGLPVGYAEQVARIGGKPLVDAPVDMWPKEQLR